MPPGGAQQHPLLKDLLHIPEQFDANRLVVKLSDESNRDEMVRQYVTTPGIEQAFDGALRLIGRALADDQSKASYLHGSFGSGKSHFMAVLRELLNGNPHARDKFAALVQQHSWVDDSRFLLVPYHMIGARSVEHGILGGYVRHVQRVHPEAETPRVYRAQRLVEPLRNIRASVGDEAFLAKLRGSAAEDNSGWGKIEKERKSGWTPEQLDAALSDSPTPEELDKLVNEVAPVWLPDYIGGLAGETDAYVPLDQGMSEIARHAKSLGYTGLVLFLDELVLWLSGRIQDNENTLDEAAKLANLTESNDTSRALPIISFVARQRDLRELAGDMPTGADEAKLQDHLSYWDGRFETINLGDENLPVVARHRVLLRREGCEDQLAQAFERTERIPSSVRDVLLEADNAGSFEESYPFSPVFMDTLVKVSAALQRERTALKLMQQILINRREELRLGELIPLGDLFDAIAEGYDAPFTQRLKAEFDKARSVYKDTLRPELLRMEDLREDQLTGEDVPQQAARFKGMDRLVKTLLLASLAPSVPALRELTASRLLALNHGQIRSPIPGQERSVVTSKLRELERQVPELHVDTSDDPRVRLELTDIDVDKLLQTVTNVDTEGDRRRLVRRVLFEELGVENEAQGFVDYELAWRGSARTVEVGLENVRGLSAEEFGSQVPDRWRLVLDYPFDVGDHGAAEAHQKAEFLGRSDGEEPPRTVVWVPRYLTGQAARQLGKLLQINYLLRGDNLEKNATQLGADQRQRAKELLENHRESLDNYLRNLLRSAYGLSNDTREVQTAREYEVHSPVPNLHPRIDPGRGFADTLYRLADQCLSYSYPNHPNLDPRGKGGRVSTKQLQEVLEVIRRAVDSPSGERADEIHDRKLRDTLRDLAHPLQLGQEIEGGFVIDRHWGTELEQRIHRDTSASSELTVRQVRRGLADLGVQPRTENLIIGAFAEFTQRSWFRGGDSIPAPGVTDMADDMVLRRRPMPSQQQWEEATRRAQLLFGANKQGTVPSPRLVAKFADIKSTIVEHSRNAAELVNVLEEHAEQLGLDTTAPAGRYATAREASGLVSELVDLDDPVELVKRLADHQLRTDEHILLKSLRSAREVSEAIRGADWTSIGQLEQLPDSRAGKLLETLHEAARHNENATSLPETLRNTKQQAQALIGDMIRRQNQHGTTPDPNPEPGPEHTGSTDGTGDGRPAGDQPATNPAPAPPAGTGGKFTISGTVEEVTSRLRQLSAQYPSAHYTVEVSVHDEAGERT
ncbi:MULTISPECIES: hypothetical protein [unclassified Actinopolyspora]|uniref:hypothetical protein n=1 Tax=unclassified Actinopolyspora TaxID=2639451 RepID=UPI0013F62F35|nr:MULTISPECIES: hypothetical protein [unclassified Actinopolyspora]NHD18835.1 hypothetical protein [Actinopolyspora sp. BKK2]NHE77258.1 hypothetical protein [Actinopolyspora sp. BKK1]